MLVRVLYCYSVSLTSQSPSSTLPTSPNTFSSLIPAVPVVPFFRVDEAAAAPVADAIGATGVDTLSAPLIDGAKGEFVLVEDPDAGVLAPKAAAAVHVFGAGATAPHPDLGAVGTGARRLASPPRFLPVGAGVEAVDNRGEGIRVSGRRRINTERLGSASTNSLPRR